jgi:hypothetical protein
MLLQAGVARPFLFIMIAVSPSFFFDLIASPIVLSFFHPFVHEASLTRSGADQGYKHEVWGCHGGSSTSCFQKAVSVSNSADDGTLLGLFLRNGANPNEKKTETFGGMST